MSQVSTSKEGSLGDAIGSFSAAFHRLRDAVQSDAALAKTVFANTDDWARLLAYKLVPHFAGEGCLIVAVAGGTNTGKSTVFNRLLGRQVSPTVSTAAATRRTVVAASPDRAAQCLRKELVPEFDPVPLTNPDDIVHDTTPMETMFVCVSDDLPERFVLLDTPDVDSIDKRNWEVANNIRAAGDVLIAVLTAEKYKDDRVVGYFREALTSGRVLIPLMNKANPDNGHEVAKKQLQEFCELLDIQSPCFIIDHDFEVEDHLTDPVTSVDGDTDLWTYLKSLDSAAIIRRVHSATLKHVLDNAGAFLEHVDTVATELGAVVEDFELRATAFATKYDPAPGEEVGGMFHEYVQARRGPIRRIIGSTSRALVNGISAVGRTVTGAFARRTTLETEERAQTDQQVHALHAKAIERIARDLATSYVASAGNLREPAEHLVAGPLREIDVDAVVSAVIGQALGCESVSDEFRQHAYRMLDSWWEDHAGKRRVLEGLDAMLAVAPAAIAAPLSLYTGGIGVAETVVVAGPIVEQFVARVIEYQFGDAMFDFLSPWKTEQQEGLADALLAHIARPALHELEHYLHILRGDSIMELKRGYDRCLQA